MIPLIKAKWENGCLVYRDLNRRVVDVVAPRKLILNPLHAGTIGDGAYYGGQWIVSAVNSGTVAGGSVFTVTTGGADDDDVDLASAVGWNAAKGLTIEAKIRNDDIDKSAFNLGFSDAIGEAADKIAYTYATATLTGNADDAALFFTDSDGTTNYFRCATSNNGTESTVIATTSAPVDATYNTFKIDITAAGAATFYLDDVNLGTASLAVRSAVDLCAYVGYITREAGANTLDIHDLAVWQWTA